MAQYYYDRYTAVESIGSPSSWAWPANSWWNQQGGGYPNLSLAPRGDGSYIITGIGTNYTGDMAYDLPVGSVLYNSSGYVNAIRGTKVDHSAWHMSAIEFANIPKSTVRGSYVGSVVAENGTYPANGKASDGYWYVRGSMLNNAPTVPPSITATGTFSTGTNVTISWGASTDSEGSAISYYLERRHYKNGVAQAWDSYGSQGVSRSLTLSIPDDPTINRVEYRVRAYDGNAFSAYRNSTIYEVTSNKVPTITLNTTDNRTLFENDSLSIDGTTTDTDTGNVITVRYSLNGVTDKAIATAISAGVAIPFSKVLQVKNSKLMDGETVLLDNLIEGQANTLRVWATDDKGGVSTEQVRTFFVTPNRPPSLTIDSFTQKVGLIDSDYITITGSVVDPEGGNVLVKYQIGEVNPIQVHDGPGGKFTFDIPLANLIDGENSIILLATDSLNFTSQKTLKVTKAVNKTELLQSVRRYKALPPKGSAKNVIIWVQRDINLSLSAEASMVMQNEAENFVEMTKTNSAPVTDTITEDEFTISSDLPKDDIVFQFNMTRSSIDSTDSIHLISGGFE